jgi:hypothetical protein
MYNVIVMLFELIYAVASGEEDNVENIKLLAFVEI